jgi:hypothetical protein
MIGIFTVTLEGLHWVEILLLISGKYPSQRGFLGKSSGIALIASSKEIYVYMRRVQLSQFCLSKVKLSLGLTN